MRRSSYALMLLLYVAAVALPVLMGFVCGYSPAAGAGALGEAPPGHCLLAACGTGPGVICRTVY